MRRLGGLFLVSAVAGGLWAAGAYADTFKPTRFDDPVPNGCTPSDCSLREAIAAANGKGGRDEVVLQEGTYDLEIPGDQPNGGDLEPVTPMELRGKGARETKIDANGIDRVISIGCGTSARGAQTIKRMTLKGGDPGANPFNCIGPGMQSIGGGILTFEKALKLESVTIKGNEAAFGGGIRSVAGKLTIKNSTIAGNNAAEGGGLDLRSFDPQPVTEIRSSTISGNFAFKGAGILADGLPDNGEVPKLALTNSTVAGNEASNEGGGIMADNAAVASLDNTTVAYNETNSDNVGTAEGGGIYQHSGAIFEVDDSLVAENLAGQGGDGPQCAGDFDVGAVVVQDQAGVACDFSGSFTSVSEALIGPLAKNGGPTKTVAVLEGSPAINSGALNCPPKDQRGEARPGNDDKCDAGAFERTPSDP